MVISFPEGERRSTAKPPLTQVQLAHYALKQSCQIKDLCKMCGARIRTLIFQGTGVCCDDCRKDRDGDHEPAQGIVPVRPKRMGKSTP